MGKVQVLVREHGLERQVHLSGLVVDPALPMASMDLYVTINIGPVTGVAALEAAFSGLPVIAIQMLPTYKVQPQDWIWSSNDVQAVAREAVRLLADKNAREQLAQRQTAFVRAHHTVEVMASSYYLLYERALSRRRSQGVSLNPTREH